MYLWSTLVYLSLVAWLPITSAVELGAAGSSFSGSFARVIGRVLRGHVGHEFEAINPVFCRKKCGLYKNCVSINVFALPDQKFLCQLNIARKQDCPDAQFVQSTSGEYYEVKEQNVCTKPGVCGAGLYLFMGSEYKLDPQIKLTWDEGRAVCVADGFDLVSINTRAEYDFLHDLGDQLLDAGSWRAFSIGLSKMNSTHMQWADGTYLTSDKWLDYYMSGEPSSESEPCHTMHLTDGYFDVLCTNPAEFVCEKKIAA